MIVVEAVFVLVVSIDFEIVGEGVDVLDTAEELVSITVLYIDHEIILEGDCVVELVLVFDIDELPDRVGLEDDVFDSLAD